MDHLVFYSSGIASWVLAKRVAEQYGTPQLLFTDTLGEDSDNYRFMIEGAANITGRSISLTLRQKAASVPPVFKMEEERKEFLHWLRDRTKEEIPELNWMIDGRTIWEVFRDAKYIGNNRIDPCSKQLKRDQSKKFVKENYNPEDVVLYIGIDWSESHRTKAPIKHWNPYEVRFPLTEHPLLTKQQMFDLAKEEGIKYPSMYDEGFEHANCAGICVKSGQAQHLKLLQNRPDVYYWHEKEMEDTIDHIGKHNGFIRKTIKGTLYYLSLKQFREMVEEEGSSQVDLFSGGGCDCFYPENVEEEE